MRRPTRGYSSKTCCVNHDCETNFRRRKDNCMVLEHDFLNQPVYRIFSLSRFKESLESKQLVLVPPRKWEDPFEWLPEGMIIDKRTNPWKETSVADILKPAFAQCWSRTCESDTLLRAYS